MITFVLPNETPATHRVVEIDAENERFWTKGDSNEERDGAPVYFQNLIGRPVFTIPYLGYIAHYIQNPPGMYIALACGALLLVLVFVPDLLKTRGQVRRKAGVGATSGITQKRRLHKHPII